LTRKRVVHHPGAAWVAAVAGAWLVAAACRTMQGAVASAAGSPVSVSASPAAEPTLVEPSIRVGLLVDVERVSIDADSGVVVRGQPPGETGVLVRTLPRASFRPGEAGRVLLAETGDEFELATAWPTAAAEYARADATAYRGVLEVRPAEAGRLTVVNVVNLEDYLRGVVPNELSPQAFPQIEALKAQAVAARTYALAHRRDYASKGFDVCATASCQVYRGRPSEQRLTDRAVLETVGVVATWRGRPINAYYTSTCGGHTEAGGAIFDDDAPYLKGVVCLPERSSRHLVRTTVEPRRDLPGGAETAHDVALLEALGVIDPDDAEPVRLSGVPADDEVRGWIERAERRLAPGEDARLLREEAARQDDDAPTRARVFSRLVGALERAKVPGLGQGELAGSAEGQLSVLHGEAADSHPIDPGVRLFRDVGGSHTATSELGLSVGDPVVYVERSGRVVYLEAEERSESNPSRHYRWEVRLTPDQVARAVRRYGSVGRVRDIVPKRLGVSGRVVELSVVGSGGELELKGLKVRWGLGLRENLFVVSREKGPRGDVERFVITGKGWGHGVGLCQVGAFGMAQSGSTFAQILRHYYAGVSVSPRPLL
jgi:stage II sporulation protein D